MYFLNIINSFLVCVGVKLKSVYCIKQFIVQQREGDHRRNILKRNTFNLVFLNSSPLAVEGDALSPLFFSDSQEFVNVGGERVGSGENIALGLETILVGDEFNAGETAVFTRKAARRMEDEKQNIIISVLLFYYCKFSKDCYACSFF